MAKNGYSRKGFFGETIHYDANGKKEYTVTFPETSARYLKVTARCVEEVPQWHDGRGSKAVLFVDEIIVR